jgi:hypothetical protein
MLLVVTRHWRGGALGDTVHATLKAMSVVCDHIARELVPERSNA